MRENFCNPHCTVDSQCGNYRNLVSYSFGKNFVKATFLLNKLLKSCFDEIFFSVRPIFLFFHNVGLSLTLYSVEKREILSHLRNISSNQLFSNLFSKTVTFMKFLPKLRERIPVISTQCSATFFRQINLGRTLISQKFCNKIVNVARH